MKPQNAGREILFLYNAVAHLAADYAQAATKEVDPQRQALWAELSDRALGDLSLIYEVWSLLHEEMSYGVCLPENRSLVKKSQAYFKRREKMAQAQGPWTLLRKLLGLWRRGEQDLGALVTDFKEAHPLDQKNLEVIAAHTKLRLNLLAKIVTAYAAENKQIEEQTQHFLPLIAV